MVFSRLEEIEARFNFTVATASLRSGGWKACFYVSIVYVIAIFAGRHYMESRPKFNLRRLLFGWNMLLALFSALGVRRVAVPIFTDIISFGWDKAICSQDPFHKRGALWMYVFGLSKIPELFDTSFIVLRKQPLIFLHWYHHVTVFCYGFHSFTDPQGHVRLFVAMNFFVHMVMYSYYAVRAQGLVRLPRIVNITITVMQIAQMFIGLLIVVEATI
ncbi:very long chain fatty acid elongase 6-like [Oscarella lobularis]|uniref:very long chain fatty acid elongase 6-like n=1 Tax=Oscarella lobularis TaxID=121494 RepID=UPI003313F579